MKLDQTYKFCYNYSQKTLQKIAIKVTVSIALFFLIAFSIPTIFAQTPTPALPTPTLPKPAPIVQKPVDESNSIFVGCKISTLSDINIATNQPAPEEVPDTTKPDTAPEQSAVAQAAKQKFLVGCLQDVFRFVIVISILGVILRIAAVGIGKILPSNQLKDTSNQAITNVVIGIFLLTFGWNFVFVFNNSLANAEFFNLPPINYCKTVNSCLTNEQRFEINKRFCANNYELIIQDKFFTGTPGGLAKLKLCLEEICKSGKEFKSFSTTFCKEKFAENIDKAIKEGPKGLVSQGGGTTNPDFKPGGGGGTLPSNNGITTPSPTPGTPTPTVPGTPVPTPGTPVPTPGTPTGPVKKILFIGDSITAASYSYAALLKQQSNFSESKIIAISSKNTSWMKEQLTGELARIKTSGEKPYSFVMVFGGTNYTAGRQADLDSMYESINTYGAKVIGTTLPGSKFFSGQQRVTDDLQLNVWIKQNTKVKIIADFFSEVRSDYEPDGIHFTAGKHKSLADKMKTLLDSN